MVKGIINAFDRMEFCLVINLTIGGNRAVKWPRIIATRNVSFATTLNSRQLQKKLISNTNTHTNNHTSIHSLKIAKVSLPGKAGNHVVLMVGFTEFRVGIRTKHVHVRK